MLLLPKPKAMRLPGPVISPADEASNKQHCNYTKLLAGSSRTDDSAHGWLLQLQWSYTSSLFSSLGDALCRPTTMADWLCAVQCSKLSMCGVVEYIHGGPWQNSSATGINKTGIKVLLHTPTHVCGRALSLSPCALPGERNAERKKAGVHDDQGKKEKSERLVGPRFLS